MQGSSADSSVISNVNVQEAGVFGAVWLTTGSCQSLQSTTEQPYTETACDGCQQQSYVSFMSTMQTIATPDMHNVRFKLKLQELLRAVRPS